MVPLESSKLFSQLPAVELKHLLAAAQERSYAAGEGIFREGDPGDGLYVVRSGLVQILGLTQAGQLEVFTTVGEGDLFGEMAVLDELPRSASAVAGKETTVYFIARTQMLGMLQRSPELWLLLVQEISRRLRDFNRQYVEKVLQAERMTLVGRFASSIVHDLKNPLTIISISADEACASRTTSAERKTSLGRIHRQVDRITSMVNDILEYTRGAPGEQVFEPTDYSLFLLPLVAELKGETELKSVTIEYQNPPPGVILALNPRRLSRVFFNLVSNAVDAMPQGGIIRLRFQTEPDRVVTEIHDTGPGIAPEVLDRVFEAFVTHGKPRGTGLGLSICQRIVEEHGGTLSATNHPQGGALFTLTLPRNR